MEGVGTANFYKDTFPHEISAIMPSTKQSGCKNKEKFRDLSSVAMLSKPLVDYGAKWPHNLGNLNRGT
jgi:hypothetical protein